MNDAIRSGSNASDDEEDRDVPRRALLAGALAMAAGIAALERPEPAAATDPNDVLLGGSNSTPNNTRITCTGATSATALVLHADNANYGIGVDASGSAYGVYGRGEDYAGVSGDTSGIGASGLTGQSRSAVDGYGVTASNSSAQNGAGGAFISPGVALAAGAGLGASYSNLDPPTRPVAVYGVSNAAGGIGAVFTGGRSPLRLLPSANPGSPATGEHGAGEFWVSSDGRLYFCASAGTPGVWVELGVVSSPAAKRSTLVLLPTPERFVDTRIGLGGVQGPISQGNTTAFTMTGRDGQAANPALRIPDDATAIIGNLTAIGGASAVPGAFLTIWPGGDQPTVSNLNYGPGLTIANSFVVGLAPQNGHGTVQVFNHSDCDYILDVSGYYIDM